MSLEKVRSNLARNLSKFANKHNASIGAYASTASRGLKLWEILKVGTAVSGIDTEQGKFSYPFYDPLKSTVEFVHITKKQKLVIDLKNITAGDGHTMDAYIVNTCGENVACGYQIVC